VAVADEASVAEEFVERVEVGNMIGALGLV
jgi:hypothetical protein